MKTVWILASLLLLGGLAYGTARAEEVDVELVLAVDVSGSMTSSELRIQRRGYVEAFRSSEVHNAIMSGLIGKVAVMYVEWARFDLKRVIVPWSVIDGAATSNAFADRLELAEIANMANTSISGAISYGMEQIVRNKVDGLRRVIDISGDGPNNQGGRVDAARDEAVAAGYIINGLPLMTEEGFGNSRFNIADLDDYFTDCVIGGPGSFVIPVYEWNGFAEAVRRKLVLELAGSEPVPVVRTQFLLPEKTPTDCLIGERLRGRYDDP